MADEPALVRRLLAEAEGPFVEQTDRALYREAAQVLSAQRQEIERLREGLKPFAAIYVGVDDAKAGPDEENWFQYDGDILKVGDFRRARALTETKE